MAKTTKKTTASVEDKLKALHQLQVIDTKVDKIRIIRGELPLEIVDLTDLIAGLNTRLEKFDAELVEMKSCRSKGVCCGAGGAQMFKDAEPGDKEVNIKRTEQVLEVQPEIVAAACPFCNTMMTDGIKNKEQEGNIQVMDIAELIANANDL